ncbi:hypothetical protein [Archangium sp.]|uniref:hypothetical protein n=1 Tax=Archangium sp. TaxID=1872627 RepID=UPI002D402B6F|nr:hypothetical protein [Archangium sp.]HYO58803.1 hypothetical protein [Archangium sp.]
MSKDVNNATKELENAAKDVGKTTAKTTKKVIKKRSSGEPSVSGEPAQGRPEPEEAPAASSPGYWRAPGMG